MKKIFIIFFILCIANANDNKLMQIYLEKGINAVEIELEKSLSSREFWFNYLKDKDIKYGLYSKKSMLVNVNKEKKLMEVYEYNDGVLTKKFSQEVLTGLRGDKKVEGDLITPVGFYESLSHFTPEDTYYGPTAFVLSYPNIYDKYQNKTGGGIWIHGYPLEGDLRLDTFKTRGCVALTNDLLLDFEKIVAGKKTYALINDSKDATLSKDDAAIILADLFAWRYAWQISDTKSYLSFYDKKFKRYDGLEYDKFVSQKTEIFSRGGSKIIKFSNINISPYPTIDDSKIFRVAFDEYYKAGSYSFTGEKNLYVTIKNGKMQIIVEK